MNKKFLSALSLAATISSSFAGTMGPASTYPSGFLIGGDIGYGYLSTQEGDLWFPVPTISVNGLATSDGTLSYTYHHIGSLVGGGFIGYEFPVLANFLPGVEVGYKYLGSSKYKGESYGPFDVTFFGIHIPAGNQDIIQNVRVEQQAIDLLVTGRLYFWDKLNVFGKAGGAYVYSSTKQNFSVLTDTTRTFLTTPASSDVYLNAKSNIWRINPELAIGAGYLIRNNLGVNITYTFIGGTDGNTLGASGFYSSLSPDNNPGTFRYNALTAGVTYNFDLPFFA